MGALAVGFAVFGQTPAVDASGCDCPSCQEKADSGKEFTLPGLQGLEELGRGSAEQASHEHGAEEHAGCNHDHDSHDGHDHGAASEGVELAEEMAEKVGVQIREARGGTLSKAVVFPAEIKLNRDRSASVSPRYASIVRQVSAEIGDSVRKGDVLAALENRETMAVYTVSAPLDGVIVSKDLAVGEIAGEDKVLFEVADLSTVWADISIFPQYQHLLNKGMSVEFVAHDGHTARGTVKYISPIVSHETRTFTARCVLVGADEDFTPGAFVRARIHVETAQAAVAVERDAIQIMEGEPVVFVPSGHGFRSVVVELGLSDGQSVEIRNGLRPGERYVAAGAFSLKAQMVTRGMDPHAGHGH
jgi:cobalt-zinc-cadmium efflux system membrane fusion protein